jgi:hypothetical protein
MGEERAIPGPVNSGTILGRKSRLRAQEYRRAARKNILLTNLGRQKVNLRFGDIASHRLRELRIDFIGYSHNANK